MPSGDTTLILPQKQTEEEAIKQLCAELSGKSVEQQRNILTEKFHHGKPKLVHSYLERQLNRSGRQPIDIGFTDTGHFEVAMYELSNGTSIFYELNPDGFEYLTTIVPPYLGMRSEQKHL